MTAERVRARWPVLAAQIESALHAADELALAATLEALSVVDMCSCQDDFCQSFRTAPPPDGAYGQGHRCIPLDAPWPGYLVLDVVHEKIMYVEVLYRAPLD